MQCDSGDHASGGLGGPAAGGVSHHGYPRGFLTRRVNNSGDISWHKDRVFISEVFRFEDLGFESVAEDFYKVFFSDLEIGEFDVEALRFRPVQVLR